MSIILKAIADQKTPEEEDEEEDDVKEFLTLLTTTVTENLGDTSSVPAGVTLFWTLAHYRPSTLDNLLPTIMKTFSKLCKDHITMTHQGSQTSTSKDNANLEFEAKMTTKLLEKILKLCASRISNLGDQRRIFLSLLAQLIERSLDKDTLEKLSRLLKLGVFENRSFPTTKEKAAILSKMMVFEIRGSLLCQKNFIRLLLIFLKMIHLVVPSLLLEWNNHLW